MRNPFSPRVAQQEVAESKPSRKGLVFCNPASIPKVNQPDFAVLLVAKMRVLQITWRRYAVRGDGTRARW